MENLSRLQSASRGRFSSIPEARKPSGTAVDASCVHRLQGSADGRHNFGEDCRRRKYPPYSEKGSQSSSSRTFTGSSRCTLRRGKETLFRHDGKVDVDELGMWSRYTATISRMNPMHSAEGPEDGEILVTVPKGSLMADAAATGSPTERPWAPEATTGLRRGGVLGISTSPTIRPCKG